MKAILRHGVWIFALGFLVLGGCKSTKVVSEGTLNERITARVVIKNHLNGIPDFKTISGRLGIDYNDGENSQSVSVSLRMKKDEIIWLSAPLGMAKVYITPNRVSFYNKLSNEFFDGDFSYVSKLLGSDLDFKKLQNLLIGQTIVDLNDQKYEVGISDNKYELKPKLSQELIKLMFKFEPKSFRLSTQQLSQPLQKRLLEIRYAEYQTVSEKILPDKVYIAAIEDKDRVIIDIDYRQIELNRDLSFPYKIPNGFSQIVLN